ncbi:MAG: hypothetical protein EHM24_28560, partial [Acidobacteria bacterium]
MPEGVGAISKTSVGTACSRDGVASDNVAMRSADAVWRTWHSAGLDRRGPGRSRVAGTRERTMSESIDRRRFLIGSAALAAGALTPAASAAKSAVDSATSLPQAAPAVHTGAVKAVVISDRSGIQFKNGGPVCAVEKAFQMITAGSDVLDAIVAGINIPELDPAETGIGYGGLGNADGVVQLDSCCMHGPKKRAGGVAALEGVRTPSLVAKAVMEHTDHHLLVGKGAQDFARMLGIPVEADLNTPRSRELWLEWKRR